ncbi:MAG: oligosaccharide flippase family protein [Candidatus Latescibacteria bacterium]|nr:oligosaccharide flippase family protein [Candidatus Latescibacterota bacterium]
MFTHIRRLFKHSVAYGMAETISRGTGFILVYIYARVLSAEDIGIRTAVYGASAFLGLFCTLGLDNAFLRYFMNEELADKKKEIFSTALCFSFFIGLIFLLIVSFNAESVSKILTNGSSYPYIICLLFVILIFDSMVIYPTLVLRAENRLGYFSLIAFARFTLFIFLNIMLVWILKRGLVGVFEANLIVVVFISILLLPVFRTNLGVSLSIPVLKRMLSFGVPTIFTILSMRVIDLSDRYVIMYILGESGKAELGKYSVAYTLGMVGVMVFVNSFRLAWQPFFLSIEKERDAGKIFSRVATYYTMFIGMVILGITLFRQEIFSLYASTRYSISLAGIVPIVSFAYILFGLYIIMLAGIFIREKTKYLPAITFTAASINVGLNFIFIPAFGIIGAAYTTVIAYVTMALLMYVISYRVYRVNYEFKRLFSAVLITALPLGLSLIVQPKTISFNFLYRAVLLMLPPVAYIFSGFLLPEESHKLKTLYETFIGKIFKK